MVDVTPWCDGINRLLAQVSPGTVSSGILNWQGRRSVPDGSPSPPVLTQTAWEEHYAILELAALRPGIVTPLALVQRRVRDVAHDGPFPLALAYFRYAAPRDQVVRAFTDPAIPASGRPAILGDAIEERTAFMTTVLLPPQFGRPRPQARAHAFQLILDRSLFLAPPGTPLPDEITVQAGKNAQTCSIRFGERVTCVAEPNGSVEITLTARWGTTRLAATCALEVGSTAPAPRPDERWKLVVPGGLRGEGFVYRARMPAAMRRFLILAEGFPGSRPPGYMFDQVNQHGLAERFLAKGFDLVTVSFEDGLNLMELNAEVLIEALQRANESVDHAPGHVVGGVSMGGLIARYALTAMEHRGLRHGAAVYLSLDVPHQGSRTSVANQWFARFFSERVPHMRSLVHLLESPSNQQFLPQWLHDGQVFESPLRRRFFEALALMGGHPKLTRNLAVACGRGDGRIDIEPGSVMLAWNGMPFVAATLRTQSAATTVARMAEGVSCPMPDKMSRVLDMCGDGTSWEGVPGSYERYNQLIGACVTSLGCGEIRVPQPTACVVPTVSALDLQIPPDTRVPPATARLSWFDDYVCPDENLGHTELTASICDWIVERVDAVS